MKSAVIRTVLTGCFFCGSFVALVSKFADGVTGGLWVPVFALICFVLYWILMFSVKVNRIKAGYLKVLIGAFSAAAAGNLGLFAVFFRNGEYCNRGMAGTYFAAALCAVPFLLSGIIVTATNKKKTK